MSNLEKKLATIRAAEKAAGIYDGDIIVNNALIVRHILEIKKLTDRLTEYIRL